MAQGEKADSPLGLHPLPIIGQVGQQLVVSLMEQRPGALLQHGVDVSGAGSILASLVHHVQLRHSSVEMGHSKGTGVVTQEQAGHLHGLAPA